ncbi:MAG: hypothetical protein HQ578_01105 [Chloroflexi bacterium]|nr:hypothetical protein [Chloroflexota bacterium]
MRSAILNQLVDSLGSPSHGKKKREIGFQHHLLYLEGSLPGIIVRYGVQDHC